MPRIARGLIDGGIYHVLNRGNGKRDIFHKTKDFAAFHNLICETKKRYKISILAYCLMPNHFHLVLRPMRGNDLSRSMQWLMTTHVRRYHRYYNSTGHVWQGRYKSFIIQQDAHLLTVLRYVERNPVRGDLVLSAKDWEWSSHRERIGQSSNPLLSRLPISLPPDWECYVDRPLTDVEIEGLRHSVKRQSPYGEPEWQLKVGKQLGLESTLRSLGRPRSPAKRGQATFTKRDTHLFLSSSSKSSQPSEQPGRKKGTGYFLSQE